MNQILRIVFRSGKVAEYRGSDDTVEQIFNHDDQDLIDYIMSVDLHTGAIGFFTEVGDERFLDEWVLTAPALIKRNKEPDSP